MVEKLSDFEKGIRYNWLIIWAQEEMDLIKHTVENYPDEIPANPLVNARTYLNEAKLLAKQYKQDNSLLQEMETDLNSLEGRISLSSKGRAELNRAYKEAGFPTLL